MRSSSSYTLAHRRARAEELAVALRARRRRSRSRFTSSRRRRCWTARSSAQDQRVELERLGDEVVGAGADRRDRRLEAAERGDHDHRHVGPVGDDALAQLEAAHAAHVEVGDDDVELGGCASRSSASRRVVAQRTAKPRAPRSTCSISRMPASSSTTRTRPLIRVLMIGRNAAVPHRGFAGACAGRLSRIGEEVSREGAGGGRLAARRLRERDPSPSQPADRKSQLRGAETTGGSRAGRTSPAHP